MGRKTYEELEAENKNLRQELTYSRDEISWIYTLFTNVSLSAVQKIILACTRRDINNRPQAKLEDGFTPVFQPAIEKMSGIKRKTIGTTHQQLAKSHIIERKEVYERPGDMQSRRIYIKILDDIKRRPADIKLAEERNHGGKRTPTCRHCGSGYVEVITKVTLYCRNRDCEYCGVGEPLVADKKDLYTEASEPEYDDQTSVPQYEHVE
jgi:hypothetical protein